MIGSQCVHAATSAPPAEVLMSRECDILIEDSDPARERVEAELGEQSHYYDEHGTFIDTVSPTFPFLPDGWEQRANVLAYGDMTARCLELHDLVLSKLVAGRLKDNALIHYKHRRRRRPPHACDPDGALPDRARERRLSRVHYLIATSALTECPL
jgi:hypothetical protein